MSTDAAPATAAETEALQELAAFPLLEAVYGRRSRRFAMGCGQRDADAAR